MANNTIDLGI